MALQRTKINKTKSEFRLSDVPCRNDEKTKQKFTNLVQQFFINCLGNSSIWKYSRKIDYMYSKYFICKLLHRKGFLYK